MKFHVRYSGNRMGEVVLSKCEILNPRIWWPKRGFSRSGFFKIPSFQRKIKTTVKL